MGYRTISILSVRGGVNGRSDVLVMNVDTEEVQRLTDDGRSRFVFWHDSPLAVETAEKLSDILGSNQKAGYRC